MQFLEWSIIGLRSARHVFRHAERDITVTLFPMVHVAQPEFYEAVYDDAAAHDVVVTEGVSSRTSRRLTRVYRWLRPARLGLVVQPKFAREGARTVLADPPGAAFEALWSRAPRRERLMLEAGATLIGLWWRVTATRASIGKRLNSDDGPDRDRALAWTARTAPLLDALMTARDATLCDTLCDLTTREDAPRRVAVIYGAGHMGAVTQALDKAGFRLVESEWMEVFAA